MWLDAPFSKGNFICFKNRGVDSLRHKYEGEKGGRTKPLSPTGKGGVKPFFLTYIYHRKKKERKNIKKNRRSNFGSRVSDKRGSKKNCSLRGKRDAIRGDWWVHMVGKGREKWGQKGNRMQV